MRDMIGDRVLRALASALAKGNGKVKVRYRRRWGKNHVRKEKTIGERKTKIGRTARQCGATARQGSDQPGLIARRRQGDDRA